VKGFYRASPVVIALTASLGAQQTATPTAFSARDVFDLEWVTDPQISPDGRRVIYGRTNYDILKDTKQTALWIVNTNGGGMHALLSPKRQASSPRWSPDGRRVAFVSTTGGKSEIVVRWIDSRREVRLAKLPESPAELSWSPDGTRIAFLMFVAGERKPPVSMIEPPRGANWGPPLKFIESLNYRADGEGYLRPGYRHIFVLSAEGGAPRQVTDGSFDDGEPVWTPDGKALLFSANRAADAEYDPVESEIYDVSLANGSIRQLTHRKGPDISPAVSPDGKLIAYAGNDDRLQAYQVTHLYVMNRDGGEPRMLVPKLDRDLYGGVWSSDGTGLYVQYDDEGDTKLAFVSLTGEIRTLANRLGGLSIDRPSGGAQFTVAANGRFAFTLAGPDHPADLATGKAGAPIVRVTKLSDRIWAKRKAATVEEIWFQSTFDQRRIQGWITKPVGFDARRKYPLILEIHGGPFDNYGARFSATNQLYAADGFVVLSTNPRGSTSYGEEFGNLIQHDYPGHDYDDLMSGVDAVIARGDISPDSLFVTGGSGGAVLTTWIVGHTRRFRAAVAAKPVVNWESGLLTSDLPMWGRYLFGKMPWEDPDLYRRHSPLTYVANVTTPTMVITGEQDYRATSSEAEQFYTALKLRRIPAAMLRIPDASHGIDAKASNLIAQVMYTIGWFDKYRGK